MIANFFKCQHKNHQQQMNHEILTILNIFNKLYKVTRTQIMSVYSGFVTRKQESLYFSLSETFIQALIKRIIKFYRKQSCEEQAFKDSISKLYSSLNQLEQIKHMNPKYSQLMAPLLQQLQIKLDENKKVIVAQQQQDVEEIFYPPRQSPTKKTNKLEQISPVKKRRLYSSKKIVNGENQYLHDREFTLGALPDAQKLSTKYSGYILKQNIKQQDYIKKESQDLLSERKNTTIKNNYDKSRKQHSADKYKSFIEYREEMDKNYAMLIDNLMNPKSFKRKRYELKRDQLQKFSTLK